MLKVTSAEEAEETSHAGSAVPLDRKVVEFNKI